MHAAGQVYFCSEELSPVNLDGVEQARLKLICNCCGKRGACVQCAGGRCLTAYHPWCLIHAEVGKVHRALRNGNELQVSGSRSGSVSAGLAHRGPSFRLGAACGRPPP